MRFVTLVAAAFLGLAALAHADGKEGRTLIVPPISPLEATHAPPMTPASYHADYEVGLYRFGSTYSVRDGSTPAACEATCADAVSCQSWSFVASYGASPARCELKRGGGRMAENPLAISGVSPALREAMWGASGAMAPSEPPALPVPGQLMGGAAQTGTYDLIEAELAAIGDILSASGEADGSTF